MTADSPTQTLGSVGLKVSSDRVCGLRAFTARLTRLHGLSDGDGAALGQLPSHETVVAAGQDIVRVGDRADRCAIILEGLAFGYKLTGDGRRQILCFNLAGDMLGPPRLAPRQDGQGRWPRRADVASATCPAPR